MSVKKREIRITSLVIARMVMRFLGVHLPMVDGPLHLQGILLCRLIKMSQDLVHFKRIVKDITTTGKEK